MRPSSPALAAAFADGAARRRRRRGDDRARLDRPALLRLRRPRPPRRDVHRQPQPRGSTTGSSCAGPGRSRSVRRPGSTRSGTPCRRPEQASDRTSGLDLPARRARGVRRPPARTRTGRRSSAQGRRRRRQRHGRAHRTGGLRADRLHRPRRRRAGADVLRARRHLPAPRGQPDRAGEPRRPPGAGRRRERRHRSGLRRRRRPLLRGRRAGPGRVAVDADRADRGPRAGQASPARP